MVDGVFAGPVRFLALRARTKTIASEFALPTFGSRLDWPRSLDTSLLLLLLMAERKALRRGLLVQMMRRSLLL